MSIEKIKQGDSLTMSMDLVGENIEKLKELFPEILTEGKIDFKVLKQVLGEEIEEEEEYYKFTWAGKSKARQEAHKPSTGTLRPCKEDSVDWDNTKNLYIEGDNLEVLKLMQKSYAKKVKMIYIDPPYNTGKDFVYKDNYKDNLANYKKITGQVDDEGNALSTNTESDGRFHSNWLNMMYPRLILARNLLKEDGVIFMSIGVEEFANLKSVANDVFGEDNFIEVFSWVKTSTPPALSTKSRKTNEYILCYERNKNSIKYNGEPLDGGDQPLLNSGNSVRILKFPKNKVYFQKNRFSNGKVLPCKPDRVSLIDEIEIIDGYAQQNFRLEGEFKWTQEFLEEELLKGTSFIIKSDKLSIRFIRDEEGFKRPTNYIKEKFTTPIVNKPINGVGTNENASSSLCELMKGIYFDYPKPEALIKYLINFVCASNDIILDFFSGSATTAHAVMQLNAEDRGKRRHIQVQLPEPTDEKSEAYKAGFKTIAEIGKERIRRAAKKIAAENPDKAKDMDLGFKVFKLDESNIKAWEGKTADLQQGLWDTVENIKEDRTEEDILFEILLKYGLDLTLPIEEKEIAGLKVYNVGFGAIFICLGDKITRKVSEGIGEWKKVLEPEICRVIFKDSGLTTVEKANSLQILKSYGINEIRSI